MESVDNYWLFWLLYLLAAAIFMFVFWKITRFERAILSSYCLRAVAIALIFTPWYSDPQGSGMAPALMVATLDAITVSADASFRSFVPLVLALIFALLIASVLAIAKKKLLVKSFKNNEIEEQPEVNS